MSEARQLEVRPGDTVFILMEDNGAATMSYIHRHATLPEMVSAFEAFLRAAGYQFDGSLDVVHDDSEPQWAVDVREFLDELANPDVYGWTCGDEARKRAAELRDA